MLFLINRRYPVLGAVLSAISNIVFLALGLARAIARRTGAEEGQLEPQVLAAVADMAVRGMAGGS